MATLPLIELVKRQARATFSKVSISVPKNFEENLSKLKTILNKISSRDVNLDLNLLQPIPRGMEAFHAPVTYIEVMDDPNFTIGIFVLKQGARLPLHDHPLMYGILKVIHGSVHIQSYSLLPATVNEVKSQNISSDLKVQPSDINLTPETLNHPISLTAVKEPAIIVSDTDNVCVLSPISGNIHEINTVNGPAAFLDILAPPYNTDIDGIGPRPCRYFVEVEDALKENEQDKRPLKRLLRVRSPSDYWSSSAPYQGP